MSDERLQPSAEYLAEARELFERSLEGRIIPVPTMDTLKEFCFEWYLKGYMGRDTVMSEAIAEGFADAVVDNDLGAAFLRDENERKE